MFQCSATHLAAAKLVIRTFWQQAAELAQKLSQQDAELKRASRELASYRADYEVRAVNTRRTGHDLLHHWNACLALLPCTTLRQADMIMH